MNFLKTKTSISIVFLIFGIFVLISHTLSTSYDTPIIGEYNNKVVYTTSQNNNINTTNLINDCNSRGGIFNTCGSICENNDSFCPQICAYTCELKPNTQNYANQINAFERKLFKFNKTIFEIPTHENMTLTQSNNNVTLLLNGPTQTEDSGLFDGIYMNIEKINIDPQISTKDYVNIQLQEMEASYLGKVIVPVQKVPDLQYETYTYTSHLLDITTHVYIRHNVNEIMYIQYSAPDPTNKDWLEYANYMIQNINIK